MQSARICPIIAVMIRRAKISDADEILQLINFNADAGLMLARSAYDVYKNITNFFVFESDGHVAGCARISVVWKDLVEIMSLAVQADFQRQGIGRKLVDACVDEVRRLKIPRAFTLTYQSEFFSKCGFREIARETLPYKIFGECLHCPKVECCDEKAFVISV